MDPTPPLVLVASISAAERRLVESSLKDTGFDVLTVHSATEATPLLRERSAAPAALVIDSGLLDARHDPQWRDLRTRHPRLGAVVRCLIGRERGSPRTNGNTFLVHPDDDAALERAVCALLAPGP